VSFFARSFPLFCLLDSVHRFNRNILDILDMLRVLELILSLLRIFLFGGGDGVKIEGQSHHFLKNSWLILLVLIS